LGERQVAEFVEDDEVHPGQMLGDTTLPSIAGLDLQRLTRSTTFVEPAAGTRSDAASGDCDGHMCFAGAGTADQHGITLLGDEAAAGEIIDSVWLMGVPSNWKSSRSLASGSLAMVSWYLIERACFSLISA